MPRTGDPSRLPSAPPEDDTATLATFPGVPRAVGNYRILRKLGEGGMGVVYEAEQQHPRRAVALKLVRGQYVDEEQIRLFEREAQTLARLKHPGIAAIYESGRTPDGQPFLAMELVRGEALGDSMKRLGEAPTPHLQMRERLLLFLKICSAVAYAHQRGVIHRDLKPSNILVLRGTDTPSGRSGSTHEVKVLDFGLARITGAEFSTVVTRLGKIQGTLPYMSPEQVRGDPGEIDLRTDVYALGVILYELLGGRLPYEVGRVILHEAARIICEERPKPLNSSWSGTRLDRDLQTIVLKALEKDPPLRYQSVTALAEDVERYLSDQPILARPPSAAYQMRKLIARHKVPFVFAATLLVLMMASAVTMVFLYHGQRRERIRADLEREKTETMNRSLQQMLDSLRGTPRGSPEAVPRNDPTSRSSPSNLMAGVPSPRSVDRRATAKVSRLPLRGSGSQATPVESGSHVEPYGREPSPTSGVTDQTRSGDSILVLEVLLEAQRSLIAADVAMVMGRYAEAESLLKPAYPVVMSAPVSDDDKKNALERFVRLYTLWGKPEEADGYRAAIGRLGDRKN